MATLRFMAGPHAVQHTQPVIASDRQAGISHRGFLDSRVSRVWRFRGQCSLNEALHLRTEWAKFAPEWDWTPPDAGAPIKVAFGNSFEFTPTSAHWADVGFSLEEILSPDT